jgi:hypothetical protein
MPWHADGDGLNVVCIDDNVALLAFSGYGRQNLNGFSVENPSLSAISSGRRTIRDNLINFLLGTQP